MQANPCGLRGGAASETRIHAASKSAQRNRTKSWSFLSDLKVRPPKQRGKRERSKLDYMLRMRQHIGRFLRHLLFAGLPSASLRAGNPRASTTAMWQVRDITCRSDPRPGHKTEKQIPHRHPQEARLGSG